MTTSPQNPDYSEEFLDWAKTVLAEVFGPYRDCIQESAVRTQILLRVASNMNDEVSEQEILRSVVVLTHAYLEDFLRTIAEHFLPLASENALNDIPLAGTLGRAEKFHLGRLAKHRNKTVDEVIRESVREHLDRSTFNSATRITAFLQEIGFTISVDLNKHLAAIDSMIERRHLIVHRADRYKSDEGYQLRHIDRNEVIEWTGAALNFMFGFMQPILEQPSTVKVLRERFADAAKLKFQSQ